MYGTFTKWGKMICTWFPKTDSFRYRYGIFCKNIVNSGARSPFNSTCQGNFYDIQYYF